MRLRPKGGPLRILHVVATGMRRGAEMFAYDLVNALGELGAEQRVVVLRDAGSLVEEFAAPVEVLDFGGRSAPWLRVKVRAVRGLRASIRDWRPQVVLAHGGEPLKYAVVAAGAPIVYRRIGAVAPWIGPGLRRRAHGRLIRRADLVVAVAAAIRRETIETFGIDPDRVVTVANAVDGRRLAPRRDRSEVRRELGIPADAPLILSAGALSWEKDPLVQARVAAGALGKVPGAVHLVAGDGPLRGELEALVHEQGLDGQVRLLGIRSDVPDLLHAADVLLLASRTEGMPGIVIEAGMAGLPVASFGVAGVPEVVADGETGLLADPGDADALTGALVALLEDAGLRRRMGAAAAERCRSQFDIAAVAPQYLQLFDRVVASR